MCLGIPGQLVEISSDDTHRATADVSGVRRTVDVGLLQDEVLVPGDWVLVHVGFAMARIDEGEAARALASLAVQDTDAGDDGDVPWATPSDRPRGG